MLSYSFFGSIVIIFFSVIIYNEHDNNINPFRAHITLGARASQPTEGLTSTCPFTEVKGHPASLGVTCGQHLSTRAVVDFLYRDYRCKSVAIRVTHVYCNF